MQEAKMWPTFDFIYINLLRTNVLETMPHVCFPRGSIYSTAVTINANYMITVFGTKFGSLLRC